MAQPTILVLGGINMDVVTVAPRFPEAGETVVGSRFFTTPGGKGANQAVAAARLGARVKMIGRVGGDPFGQQLLDALRTSGVDTSGVWRDPEKSSGIAVIHIDATAQNRIVQIHGANGACASREAKRVEEALEGVSVLLLQMEVPVEVSVEAARAAAARDVIVIFDPGPARPIPQEFYTTLDYLTPNETEAQALVGFPVLGPPSAQYAARELLRRGVGCTIIKMGDKGAYYATSYGGEYLPAYEVEAVDTVAAGDAFNGALAVALAEGKELREAVCWAMAAGAIAVTKPGAQDSMPHRQELEAFLQRHQAPRG